jgi:hypothetical protein
MPDTIGPLSPDNVESPNATLGTPNPRHELLTGQCDRFRGHAAEPCCRLKTEVGHDGRVAYTY